MPGRIMETTESQIIADILREQRRQRTTIISQMPQPAKDTFTVAATPATTYTLNAIPYQGSGGSSLNLSLNGVELVEGVDYTVDYTTAVVTVTATLKGTPTPADVLTADYWTTGDLIALSGPTITGVTPAFKNATTAGTNTTASSLAVSSPTCAAGDLLLLAFQVDGGSASGTPTGGWSLVASVNAGPTSAGDAEHYYVYTKTASSTDAAGTTYTASAGTTTRLTLACLSYGPGSVDVSATNGTASGAGRVTSWSSPTVTVADGRTLVEFYAEVDGQTGASFSGPGVPTTVRADISAGAAPFEFTLQRVIDESMAAAGTSTARTVTSGLGGAWASITIALSP